MLNSMKAAVALALAGAGALVASPVQAQAQYPNQAVKWVVPFSPGGLPDTVAQHRRPEAAGPARPERS